MTDSASIVNEPVRLGYWFLNAAGVLTDPTTVTVTIGSAAVATVTYTYGVGVEVVREAAGKYHVDFTPSATGQWAARWRGTGTVVSSADVPFDVVAGAAPWDTTDDPVYATMPQLRAALRLSSTTIMDDVELRRCLQVASRDVDAICSNNKRMFGRRFWTGASEVRTYQVDGRSETHDTQTLRIDEAQTVSLIAIDYNQDGVAETDLTLTDDYQLRPRVLPYDRVIVTPYRGRFWFPDHSLKVAVTGTFGYCLTGHHPACVNEATILLAVQYYKRPQAPFGVLEGSMGAPATALKEDPIITRLLKPVIQSLPLFV